MNFDKWLLEEFKTLNPELYRIVVNALNENDNWNNVIFALSQYRVKIFFPEYKIRNMKMVESPTEELFTELIKRSCTVEHLKDLLRGSKLTSVLALISKPEQLEIIKQPGEDDQVLYISFSDELCLECEATGLPPPQYQWYYENFPLDNENNPALRLPNFSLENEGDYYCKVSHKIGDDIFEICSHTITALLLKTLPEFLQQPPLKIIGKVGAEVTLAVQVSCPARYTLQWMFDNMILSGETNSSLTIKKLTRSNAGKYRCAASNSAGDVYTLPTVLTVENETVPPPAKVALLIANEKYANFTHLSTPVSDVILLNKKLTELKFKVITLMNLTLDEMNSTIDWFFQLVPSGSYALVCFVGHGFMVRSNKCMMPVDCPGNGDFRIADCVCDELLVMKAKENKLRLLVLVLDMCLTVPKCDENPDIFDERAPDYVYEPYGDCHVVRTFSTASYHSAYEDPKSEHGVYLQHISKYITRDQPIVDIFLEAHEDFGTKKLIKVQKPSLCVEGGLKIKLTEDALENKEFLAKFESVNKLNTIHELIFPHINIKTKLYVVPHKGKILNALDVHFSLVLSPLEIVVQVSPEILQLESKHHQEDIVLTMFNLQKAKSDVYITILLRNSEKKDRAIIDLGLPLFALAQVWFRPVR